MRYSELTVKDLFKSFNSARVSQFLAEGFATDNCFLVGAATEELIDRGEEETVAVIVRGAVIGNHFRVNSPLAVIFSEVIANSGNKHPILRAINDRIVRCRPHEGDRLWVERAIASAVDPQKSFDDDQELVRWFQVWLKEDEESNPDNHESVD